MLSVSRRLTKLEDRVDGLDDGEAYDDDPDWDDCPNCGDKQAAFDALDERITSALREIADLTHPAATRKLSIDAIHAIARRALNE